MVKAIDTQGKVSVASNEIKITTKDTPLLSIRHGIRMLHIKRR